MPKKARSGWIVSAEARSSNQIFAALVAVGVGLGQLNTGRPRNDRP